MDGKPNLATQTGNTLPAAAVQDGPSGCFLSVIINNYNYERFIGACIDSAKAALDDHCEIIVVDDGSTDGSLDIINGYVDIHVVAKENGGQASALNAGFSVARGQYIVFLDADDLLKPDALTIIRRNMPGKHMMWFAIEVLDERLGVVSFYPSSRIPPDPNIWRNYIGRGSAWFRPMSSNVFSSELLRRFFPVPEEDWRICADHITLALGGLFARYEGCADVINLYRLHGDNAYFGDVLSSFAPHLYEEAFQEKHSTNLRHFYVGAVDCLLRIDERECYAAVLSHWVTIGEILLDGDMLLERHRADVEEASRRLRSSVSPGFWSSAARALSHRILDPALLRAFHIAPGKDELTGVAVDTSAAPAPIDQTISARGASAFISGGYDTWSDAAQQEVYALTQAAEFRGGIGALSGVLRLELGMDRQSISGNIRIAGPNGETRDAIQDDDIWRVEVPCSWIVDSELCFHFVFESLAIPVVDGSSSHDISVCGAYMFWFSLNVPDAGLFCAPLRHGETAPASSFLSRLKIWPEGKSRRDGSVAIDHGITVLSMSLPFTQDPVEWLDFDITNNGDGPACLAISVGNRPWNNVIIPSNSRRKIECVVDFAQFEHRVPEIYLSCQSAPTQSDVVWLHSLKWNSGPSNHVKLPPGQDVLFTARGAAQDRIDGSWSCEDQGIRPNVHNASSAVLQCSDHKAHSITLGFCTDGSQNALAGSMLFLTANGQQRKCRLNRNGSCTLRTDQSGRLHLQGWWTRHDPSPPLLRSAAVQRPVSEQLIEAVRDRLGLR